MACAGKGYGTNPENDNYLKSHFYSYIPNYNDANLKKNSRNCRRLSNSSYPSFTPILSDLSVNNSKSGTYTLVYVKGMNFLPNGTTIIQFGNMGYIPTIFYSSFNLSFEVPLNATVGTYDVKIINIYNENFSPAINNSYSGNMNYSNSMSYNII